MPLQTDLLKVLWESIQPPKASNQPWSYLFILAFSWALANLPNRFRGPVLWISLCLLGIYAIWALILSTHLKKFLRLRRKTAKDKRAAILLSMLDTGIFIELLACSWLTLGMQMLPLNSLGKYLLVCLYGIIITIATLSGYYWFVLPSAKAMQSANSVLWWFSLIAPGTGAGIGVVAGVLLSRLVEGETRLLMGGVIGLTGAFAMGVFGAGILCETYIFAKLGLIRTSTQQVAATKKDDANSTNSC